MSYPLIVLFSAAITVVFVRGSVFAPLRQHGPALWRELAECPLCSGVWIGGAVAAGQVPLRIDFSTPLHVLGLASLTGCLALFASLVLDWLDTVAALLEMEWEDRKEQRKARDSVREAIARRAAERAP